MTDTTYACLEGEAKDLLDSLTRYFEADSQPNEESLAALWAKEGRGDFFQEQNALLNRINKAFTLNEAQAIHDQVRCNLCLPYNNGKAIENDTDLFDCMVDLAKCILPRSTDLDDNALKSFATCYLKAVKKYDKAKPLVDKLYAQEHNIDLHCIGVWDMINTFQEGGVLYKGATPERVDQAVAKLKLAINDLTKEN